MHRQARSAAALALCMVAGLGASCGGGKAPGPSSSGGRDAGGGAVDSRPGPEAGSPDLGAASDAVPWDAAATGPEGFPPPPDAGPSDAVDDAAAGEAPPAGPLAVENLLPGEVVPHDLVVLHGSARGATVELEIRGKRSTWPVVGGQFRALGLLAEGSNQITLTAGADTLVLPITYRPPTNPRFVRFLYILAANGDGRFEAPAGEANDQASALARLRVAARLMQTFTAETMRRAGFGRLTFRLARDEAHEPIVEIFRSKLTTAQARAMDGNALWSAFYQELGALPQRAISRDVAVMSMTHYLPAMKVTQAHTALGGGRLGLFGSGTLYAHATSLEDVPVRWADARMVDTMVIRDDSAGRGTYWANYATGLGAMAHELGHCLDMPHPANRRGFMSRAFDYLNRTFVIAEPRSRSGAGLAPTRPQDEAGIDRSNAVRLRFHRWLAPTEVVYGSNAPPTVVVEGGSLRISSPAGLRHVQYITAGEAAAHDEHLGPSGPATVTIPLSALKLRLAGAATVDVSAMDSDGNIGGRGAVALPAGN